MNIHWHFAVGNALFRGASSTLAILRGIFELIVDHVKIQQKIIYFQTRLKCGK